MDEVFRNVVNGVRAIPGYPAAQTRVKHAVCATVLTVLGAAFEVVGRYVPEFRKEIETWEDGRRFSLEVLPKGPSITLEKRGDTVRFLGGGVQSPQISMAFKNYDAVLPVLLGLKGTHTAFAENRVLVFGDLGKTMEINRVVNVVIANLLPGIMLRFIFKRAPRMTMAGCINKTKVYAAIVPAVIRHLV